MCIYDTGKYQIYSDTFSLIFLYSYLLITVNRNGNRKMPLNQKAISFAAPTPIQLQENLWTVVRS